MRTIADLCFYCDGPLFNARGLGAKLGSKAPQNPRHPGRTWDHRVPHVKVPACEPCNVDKGSLTVDEYRVVLAFRYGYIRDVQHMFPGELR